MWREFCRACWVSGMAWFHHELIRSEPHVSEALLSWLRGKSLATSLSDRLCPYVGRGDFHRAIQPSLISHSEPVEIKSQRITPRSNGRCPTFFKVATEMPLPIRYSVAVRPILAAFDRDAVCGCAGGQIGVAHRGQAEQSDEPWPLDFCSGMLDQRGADRHAGQSTRPGPASPWCLRPGRRLRISPPRLPLNWCHESRARPRGRTGSG